jgi:hypothetical protein
MTDSIEQPAHYCFGMMEAREIIELAIADIPDPVTAYHVATTLKYFLRTSRKGGTEDIAKGCKHAGWALDAARAHDVRESKHKKMRDGLRLGCLVGGMIPPPNYDPDSVAFRHGDLAKVCGIGDVPHMTAQALSQRDGAGDYGNPVTPCCATPWRLP